MLVGRLSDVRTNRRTVRLIVRAACAVTLLHCQSSTGGSPTPTIALSSGTVSSNAFVGAVNPAPQTVQVTNSGSGTLSGLNATVAYTTGMGWLTATLTQSTAPATLTLQPATGTLPAATYTATVSVAAPSAPNTPQTVTVTFTVAPVTAPVASAGPDQEVTEGTPVTLPGSGSDPQGLPLTYTWTQVSGTPSVGALPGQTPSFTAPTDVLTLQFDLVVSDGLAPPSAPSRVTIFVLQDAAHRLWVAPTGNDANAGTRQAPLATIQGAINKSGTAGGVYVVAGTYVGTVTLHSHVSVFGGFNPTTFLRGIGANPTVISGGATAVTASGANALTLDGVTIQSANATAGGSSIGIALSGDTALVINHTTITAGSGAAGADGARGSPGSNGADGPAGSGSSGGVGVGGGSGGTGLYIVGLVCYGPTPGGSGAGPAGGSGGAASTLSNGGAGGPGGAGTSGTTGSGGGSFGMVLAGSYVPASGSLGTDGSDGSAGGGGGGGGDCLLVFTGGGGGAGGDPGEPGGGGEGGFGGGGSFGILVSNASVNVTITNNAITTGAGGSGGNGGTGGAGGQGGQGGGGAHTTPIDHPGGSGGAGGASGNGGGGGGGGGGPSAGIVQDGTSTTNLTLANLAGNAFTLGLPGTGGTPGGAAGLQVKYSH